MIPEAPNEEQMKAALLDLEVCALHGIMDFTPITLKNGLHVGVCNYCAACMGQVPHYDSVSSREAVDLRVVSWDYSAGRDQSVHCSVEVLPR